MKEGLRKLEGPLEVRIPQFLLKYRVTPQTTTGTAPAELMGRRIRTHLDLLYPTTQNRVRKQQEAQKLNRDKRSQFRSFVGGDKVMAKNFATGAHWFPGIILAKEGHSMFRVKLDDGRIWHRHSDHLIKSHTPFGLERPEPEDRGPPDVSGDVDPLTLPSSDPVEEPTPVITPQSLQPEPHSDPHDTTDPPAMDRTPQPRESPPTATLMPLVPCTLRQSTQTK